jgi:3-hydroxyacyl-CoA dehydrogenase
MSEPVSIERHGEIAVVAIDNPPVNALSQPVRQALLDAIERVDADASVRAIVLHGRGRNFIAGADVREFGEAPQKPLLGDVWLRVEGCRKPVVAALHGAVLGGGAEGALASHYRCATRDLQFGFPEVKLGLLPGAGGTARLPRLVPVTEALELMLKGDPIGAERAYALGLVDRLVEEGGLVGAPRAAGGQAAHVLASAVSYARELEASGAGVRRVRDRDVLGGDAAAAAIRDQRVTVSRGVHRPLAGECILACVESAVSQSFDAASSKARELFEQCRASTESAALRHLFFAERRARAPRVAPRTVGRVGVLGAGTMGRGITISFALAGFDVDLVDSDGRALEGALGRIRESIDGQVRRGRLRADEAEAARHRVRGSDAMAPFSACDLIIEAVFEDLALKREVFAQLGSRCRAGAVLASNTSTLDIDAIAEASQRAADVLGMHFFSPANVMRLVEIVRGRMTSDEALATALDATKRLGKVGVVVGNGFGFVGNRMLYAYGREKELMLLEGATPEQVDRALETFGMAMGPNAVGDLAGLDVGAGARKQWKNRPDDPRFFRVSDLLVEQGRLGQKSGRGFYRYGGEHRRGEVDPEVLDLIRREAERLGVRERRVSDEEIVERCMSALINEGARCLEEGIALASADIDVIWCNGYGFPRWRGGPMFYADTLGLAKVLSAIEGFGRAQGARYWAPARLLENLAQTGGRIGDFSNA